MVRCKVCKKEFTPKTHTTGRYCSITCWYQSGDAKRKQYAICLFCGKEYYPHKGQRYCSKQCAYLGRRKPRQEVCPVCGKEIPYKPLRKQTKHCSISCANTTIVRRNKTKGQPIGTTKLTPDGYMLMRVGKYPNAYKSGWMMEHRYLMEQILGRALEKGERIHHLNGKRDDNRIENLELWVTHKDPPGTRVIDWVVDYLKNQGWRIEAPQ